ncbi:hypothetical protein EV175_005131, partial [Coemansia sp. RSA 1933]
LANDGTDVAQNPRIIGGSAVTGDNFNFVAFIQGNIDGVGTFSCTGSLIASNIVMTAGHCMYATESDPFTAGDYQVGFSHERPSDDTLFQGHSVSRVIANPDFSMKTLKNDILLLVLADNISTSEATPVKIYNGDLAAGSTITAAGFGVTDPNDEDSVPSQLMEVDLKTGTTAYCKSIWYTFDPSTQACTDGTAGKDTCQGDSGGPLVTTAGGQVAVFGITSFGPTTEDNPTGLCAQAGSSGYYTRAGAFVDWIASSTGMDVSDFAITGKSIPDTSDIEDDSSDSGDDSEFITDFTMIFGSDDGVSIAYVSGGIRTIAGKSLSLAVLVGSAIAAIAHVI